MGEASALPAALSGPALRALRTAADALIALLLAPTCASCEHALHSPTHGPVCAHCWTAIVPITPPVCDHCGDPMTSWRATVPSRCPRCCRGHSLLSRSRAIGAYDGTLRAIVHALKYDGRRQVAAPLGRLMRQHGVDVLSGADLVVPVPLHRSRRRSRGFNQAEDLAAHLGIPVVHALRRVRATQTQTELPETERQANVRDAFALARKARPVVRPKPTTTHSVEGRTIVIVDDVSTTGATLEACARVLMAAGARDVRALTAARVVTRQP